MEIEQDQYDRQKQLFGQLGQEKIAQSVVTLAGYGGLNTHILIQLAYLGVGTIYVIEHETFSKTNRNRYVGFRPKDVGRRKIDIAVRTAKLINPDIKIIPIHARLESAEAFEAIKASEYVIGGLDNDGARAVLNDVCIAYKKILIDVASEVYADGSGYGGRINIVMDGKGCLQCIGDGLDQQEVRRYFVTQQELESEAKIYGIDVSSLAVGSGPSVVSINGQIASAAVTEFMLLATGLRAPHRAQIHRMHLQTITKPQKLHDDNCPYCQKYGSGEHANPERYLKIFLKHA